MYIKFFYALLNFYHQRYVVCNLNIFHFFKVDIHRKKRGSKAESRCEVIGKVPVKF